MNLKNNIVYLAAPKRLFDSEIFDRAYRYAQSQCSAVLDPRGVFRSNDEWKDNFERVLEICDVMVIVSDDGMVGKGVYEEYRYFRRRFCKIFHYTETGKNKYLI